MNPKVEDGAIELSAIMQRARVEDLLVETDGRSVSEIAREIVERVPVTHERRLIG